MTVDLGDDYTIETLIEVDDVLVDPATTTLELTDPAGTTTTPTLSNPSVGQYRHTATLDQVGRWRWRWVTTGPAGIDHGFVVVGSDPPDPPRLDNLATIGDLEFRLGRDLTADELAEAPGLLSVASSTVRAFCGMTFTRVTDDTVILRPTHGRVRLQRPVVSITSVAPIDTDGTAGDALVAGSGYTFDGIDIVEVPTTYPSYQFVYTHGEDGAVPQVVVDVVVGMVRRVIDSPVSAEAITQVTVGQYTEQYQQAQGSPGRTPRMSRADKDLLVAAGFKPMAGTIQAVSG